jgi:hypothetical protein
VRYVPIGLFILLAFVCILFWRFQEEWFGKHDNQTTSKPADHAMVRSTPRTAGPIPRNGKLDARDIDAPKARKLIARALLAIANAKSYRMVMTSYYFSGDGLTKFLASFTLVHEKSSTRGDLLRCDTLNFSAPTSDFSAKTMKLVPYMSRTQIANETGNWDMGDGIGKEGVAFHVTGGEAPSETFGMNGSFKLDAEGIESASDDSTFDVTNGTVGEKPVLNIARTQTYKGTKFGFVYVIDSISGNLLSTRSSAGGGIEEDFDLSPKIEESSFDVPDSLVVANVENVDGAREYLEEHK